MVRGAVALDSQNVPPAPRRISNPQIDEEPGGSHLGVDIEVHGPHPGRDRLLEGGVGLASAHPGDLDIPGLRVLQERLERLDFPGPRPPQVQLRPHEVGVHDAASARPRDQHVQAPFASLLIQRPEGHRQVDAVDLAVADADQDHVALVALHVLQILHEEGLFGVAGEELLARGIAPPQDVDLVLDAPRLDAAERRDARRQVGGAAGVLHDGPSDRLRLGGVDPLALVVGAGIVAQDEPRVLLADVGAREHHEAVVVELVVRHGDQRLVAAAVVPPQHPLGRSAGAEQPQDALQVGGLAQVLSSSEPSTIRSKKLVGGSCLALEGDAEGIWSRRGRHTNGRKRPAHGATVPARVGPAVLSLGVAMFRNAAVQLELSRSLSDDTWSDGLVSMSSPVPTRVGALRVPSLRVHSGDPDGADCIMQSLTEELDAIIRAYLPIMEAFC